jgi:hypothetical protein
MSSRLRFGVILGVFLLFYRPERARGDKICCADVLVQREKSIDWFSAGNDSWSKHINFWHRYYILYITLYQRNFGGCDVVIVGFGLLYKRA